MKGGKPPKDKIEDMDQLDKLYITRTAALGTREITIKFKEQTPKCSVLMILGSFHLDVVAMSGRR